MRREGQCCWQCYSWLVDRREGPGQDFERKQFPSSAAAGFSANVAANALVAIAEAYVGNGGLVVVEKDSS